MPAGPEKIWYYQISWSLRYRHLVPAHKMVLGARRSQQKETPLPLAPKVFGAVGKSRWRR